MNKYDVAIVGGGIAGTAMAMALSHYPIKVLLIDKENDIANATTMANSAIVHAGYDAMPGTLKSKYNVEGNGMFDELCETLDVPFNRIGSLVLGFSDDEMKTLYALKEQGVRAGIPGLKIIDSTEVKTMEPNVSDKVVGALYAETAGIVSPFELAIAMTENAMLNDAEVLLNFEVKDITKESDVFIIKSDDRAVTAKAVINCAGVYSDTIASMVGVNDHKITPRKGHYYVLDKGASELFHHVLFQCPTKEGKGVLITPTVHGNVLVGPDAYAVDDKEDLETEADHLQWVKKIAAKTSEVIPYDLTIRSFAGLRATPDDKDFHVGSTSVDGFYQIAGFESPGLSSIPAVEKEMTAMITAFLGVESKKQDVVNGRRKVERFAEMTPNERRKKVEEDPEYGNIVCRCEMVTEGEIVDCIHRYAGATTLKGVKKRTRPGMGRCQGGFCGPKVMEILSRELKVSPSEVVYDDLKGYVITGSTKQGGQNNETI